MPEQTISNPIARRRFLRNVLSSAVGGAAVAGIEVALPSSLLAQTPLTPDAALRELMTGNERFDNNQLTSVEQDLRISRKTQSRSRSPLPPSSPVPTRGFPSN
jgi:hypothetical protein